MKTQRLISRAFATSAAASITFAATASAQVGGDPIPPSSVEYLRRVLEVYEDPGGTDVMVVENGPDEAVAYIYSMDPSGTLLMTSTQIVEGAYRSGLGKDRFVVQATGGDREVKVPERNGNVWNFA
jgi:hypothetical protein